MTRRGSYRVACGKKRCGVCYRYRGTEYMCTVRSAYVRQICCNTSVWCHGIAGKVSFPAAGATSRQRQHGRRIEMLRVTQQPSNQFSLADSPIRRIALEWLPMPNTHCRMHSRSIQHNPFKDACPWLEMQRNASYSCMHSCLVPSNKANRTDIMHVSYTSIKGPPWVDARRTRKQ
jgi:hypothetical protein